MKKKTITGKGYFWALLCECSEDDPLICGVYPSPKEASVVEKEVSGCPAKHYIKKCKVKITYDP